MQVLPREAGWAGENGGCRIDQPGPQSGGDREAFEARQGEPPGPGRGDGNDEAVSAEGATPAAVTECTAALLWEACRRDPDPASIRRALDGGADLSWAMTAASDQRVGALLWRALGGSGSRHAHGPEWTAFGAMADTFKMEALLLLPRAVALAVRPLTEVGLEPVVFKGPAVAVRYPEPGLRPMDDIDLLLPRADHARAVETLVRAGWQVARTGEGDHYDTVLTHDEVPSLFLEVHFGLEAGAERVTALDPEALWARRQPLECAGTPAFGLPAAENWSSSPPTRASPITVLYGWCGWPTWR